MLEDDTISLLIGFGVAYSAYSNYIIYYTHRDTPL